MTGVPPARYAFLGPAGSFCEAALRQLPAVKHDSTSPMRTISEALDSVREGAVNAALVPIENSVEGSVPVTLDELSEGDPLIITAEVVLPVTFVLATKQPDTDITAVLSHPHALAQCRKYLGKHYPDAKIIEAASTSAAAASVKADMAVACLCSPLAASRNKLHIVATDVGDNKKAETRFALVAPPGPPPPPSGNDITSLIVYIAHDKVGALLSVLTELAVRGVNLTRIESRPTGERLGRYAFYLDCTGHIAESRVGEALMGLKRVCADVRFLGSYPRDTDEASVPPPIGLAAHDYDDAKHWLRNLRGDHH